MKKLFLILLLFPVCLPAQIKRWSDATGNGFWNNPNNWLPIGTPSANDDVVLDNSYVTGSYILDLPASSTNTIKTVTISPAGQNSIRLRLTAGSTSQPGLAISSIVGDVVVLNSGGIFENSSSANTPSLTINGIVRINNGGRYIHNTASTASAIVTNLSLAPNTEFGVVEYAQGSSSTLLSSGISYNSVELSTTSTKTFGFTGNGVTTFRGFLQINSGVSFNCQKNGSINLAGDLIINGIFDFSPFSSGSIDRSLIFNGTSNQSISGSGIFTQGPYFSNISVNKGSVLSLARNIGIANATDSLIIDTSATLNMGQYIVSGAGHFRNLPLSTLSIGAANGINAPGNNSGNIQTTGSRYFDTAGIYEYTGPGSQATGTGLPSSVKKLIINKLDFNRISLTQNVTINGTLSLQNGFLSTSLTTLPTLRDTTTIESPASIFSILLSINDIGYRRSFIDGPLAINVNSRTGKWFPIGKLSATDTLFAPVKLSKFNNVPVTDTVEYFYATHLDANNFSSPPLDHISKVEYWDIHSSSGNPDNTDTITLSWRAQSKVGNGDPSFWSTAINDLTVVHYFDDDGPGPHTTKWLIDGEPTTFIANGSVNDGMISSTIPASTTASFTLGTRSPYNLLPVLLSDFTGLAVHGGNNISWVAREENELKDYIIGRSRDGIIFNDIGIVHSLSTSSENFYQFLDDAPLPGWNFYRLKLNDRNNRIFYSSIIRLNRVAIEKFTIYPNPAQKEIRVHLSDPSSISIIEFVNSRGQIILTKKISQSEEKINIESLSRGKYLIRLRNQLLTVFQSFIKQ